MKTRMLMILLVLSLMLTGLASAEDVTVIPVAFIGSDDDRTLYQAGLLAQTAVNQNDDNLYHIDLVFYEANNSLEAIDAYADAIDDDVAAVFLSDRANYADAILNDGTPTLPVFYTGETRYAIGGSFHLSTSSLMWLEALADYLISERYVTTVALAYEDSGTIDTDMGAFAALLGDGVVVEYLEHSPDTLLFSRDAEVIRESGAQAVVIWSNHADNLLTALESEGWRGTVVLIGEVENLPQSNYIEVLGIHSWSPVAYDSASQTLMTAYVNQWNTSAPLYAAAYYDGIKLLSDALENNGTNDLIDTITDTESFTGIQGEYVNGESTGSRLIGVQDAPYEIAHYNSLGCKNCADLWLPTISTTSTAQTLNIGLILNPQDGDAIRQATELAMQEVNAGGGVLDTDGNRYLLQLTLYEIDTDATAVIEQAARDEIDLLLGPDSNALMVPTYHLSAAYGITQLTSATGIEAFVSIASDSVLQIRASDSLLASAATDYLLNEAQLTRFASVVARTAYGLAAEDIILKTVDVSEEGQIMTNLRRDLATPAEGYAQAIIESQAEAVLVWDTQSAAQDLLGALGEQGWQGTFVYGYYTESFVTGLAIPADITLIAPINWSSAAQDGTSVIFRNTFQNQYGTSPTAQAAAYYDAVHLVAEAIQTVGLENLSAVGFEGVQGQYVSQDHVLSTNVVIVAIAPTGITELARYTNGECIAGCWLE